jgi:hypothetical protein
MPKKYRVIGVYRDGGYFHDVLLLEGDEEPSAWIGDDYIEVNQGRSRVIIPLVAVEAVILEEVLDA